MGKERAHIDRGAIVAIIGIVVAIIVLIVMAVFLIRHIEAELQERAQGAESSQSWDFSGIQDTFTGIQESVTGFFSGLFAPRGEQVPTVTIPPQVTPPPDIPEILAPTGIATYDLSAWRVDGSTVRDGLLYYVHAEPDVGVWVERITADGVNQGETLVSDLELGPEDRVIAFHLTDEGHYLFLSSLVQQGTDGETLTLALDRYIPGYGPPQRQLLHISPQDPHSFAWGRAVFSNSGLVLSILTGDALTLYLFDETFSHRGTLDAPRISQLVQARDGRIFNIELAQDNMPWNFILREIDIPTGHWGELIPFDAERLSFLRSAHSASPFDLYFDLYLDGAVYFYGYNLVTQESTRLFRWTEARDALHSSSHHVAHWPDGLISILYHRPATDFEPGDWYTTLTILTP